MRKTGSGLFLSISLLFSLSVEAETLTWEQCVNEASHNNAAVKSAYESWRATTSNVKVAESAYLPEVKASFEASYGENFAEPNHRLDDRYVANVTVNENILNGWADKAKIDQNQANASIAESALTIAKAQTAYELKTAYANLVYAQRSIRLQENIHERRQSNLDLVDLRFNNGSENRGSVLLSKAYLDQADLSIIQAKDSIQNANAQLVRALGRDDTQLIQVAETIPTIPIPIHPDYKSLAVGTPQRRQAVMRETVAETNITLAKSGYFPTLGVTGSYGRADNAFFPENDSWSVGLVLSVPIFNGGRDYYSTQSAISSRSAAGSTRDDLDRQLVLNLNTALNRLTEAKKNLEVNQSFLKASEMRAEIGRGRYNNGLLSFDDWDLIENDLINRQSNMIQSQRDYVLAEAAWENALGIGSIK